MITKQRVLVDLDCIHDTRYALLNQHQNEVLAKIPFDKYHTRMSDGYFVESGVPLDVWNNLWKYREVSVLKTAQPTYMLFELFSRLLDMKKATLLGTPVEPPTLTINLYPYKLKDAELSVYMEQVKRIYLSAVQYVDFVSIPPSKLGPSDLKDTYELYICYDFFKWSEINVEKFKDGVCPSTTLVIPALLKYEYAKEVMDTIIGEQVNPFKELVGKFAELISIEVVDASLVSLHPDYQKTQS